MQRELSAYTEDILVAIKKIQSYTAKMTIQDLEQNELVQDAVIRNLEVIGEAVKKIPKEVLINYGDIPWR